MKARFNVTAAAAVTLLAFSVPPFAHHGTAVYDTSRTVMIKGTVADYVWANPHVYVKV
jgi:hypothetical protein